MPNSYRLSNAATLPWLPVRHAAISGRGMELFTFADGSFSAAQMFALVGYGTALGPDSLRRLTNYFATKCGITMLGDSKNYILFDGNSMVYGQGSTSPTPENPNVNAISNDMPSVVIRALGGTSQWLYQNFGVSGYTTRQLKDQLHRRLDDFYGHGGGKRAYYVSEGINDMGSNEALTPTQAFDSLRELCAKVRNMMPGAKIVVATVTPWKYNYAASPNPAITSQADMELVRQAYNQMIRDEPIGPYWDAVADVGADSFIGVPGSNEISPGVAGANTYFADGTHCTNAGYQKMADVVLPVLQAVLGVS